MQSKFTLTAEQLLMLVIRAGILLLALTAVCAYSFAQQHAFPGAEGFGMYSTGGRGGIVYYVTDTTDNTANPTVGSLRYGITKLTGPRTILFKVSGTIALKSDLRINNGNITIAGQSAPGDGICLKNYTLRLNASNIIIRYIRSRMGDITSYVDDAMDANGTAPVVSIHDIIVDHCSMSWSIDETGSFYDNRNFTMQWCILSESMYHSIDPKGDHGYAGIWGGQNATFHHNLVAHHTSRTPRFCGARYTGDTINEIVDMRNNVLYNWGNINSAYGGEGGNHNIVNNYYKPGPATPGSATSSASNKRNRILNYTSYYYATDSHVYPDTLFGGKFYVNGNCVDGYPDVTADNWTKGVQPDSYSKVAVLMSRNRLTAPLPFGTIRTQSATEAYLAVLDSAGAILPKRDTIDTRIINETRTGTATYEGAGYRAVTGTGISHPSGIIDSQNDVGGWPVLNSTAAQVDTDDDGMPDGWETSHGLDPNNASDGNTVGSDGYTMLESYLNAIGSMTALPLDLLSFSSSVKSGSAPQVDLVWSAAKEVNTATFVVEKSTDAASFTTIGTVPAKNTANENSYSFTDSHVQNGTSYYRLKMEDKGGSFKYSKVLVVNTAGFKALSVFPNPAISSIAVTHASASKGATLDIVSMNGTLVLSKKPELNAIQTAIDVSAIKAGTYLLVFRNGAEKASVSFIK